MTSQKYSELLKDDRWQERRYDIFNLRGLYCTKCKKKHTKKEPLNVHHIKYTGMPWEAPDDDLIALCRDCHTLVHSEDNSFTNEDCIELIEKSKEENLIHLRPETRELQVTVIMLSHIEEGKFYNKQSLHNRLRKYYKHIKLEVSFTFGEFLKIIEDYIKIEFKNSKKEVMFTYYTEEEIEELKDWYPNYRDTILNILEGALYSEEPLELERVTKNGLDGVILNKKHRRIK